MPTLNISAAIKRTIITFSFKTQTNIIQNIWTELRVRLPLVTLTGKAPI
uniref:Uncharacterized protein n=1 Tax=Anguilla anguilla TaxID=7936 RepID=A0A0E9SUR1_ANGAN